mmetsp:Transcript_48701/g.136220  ORF Transcript_48701/g.136220 Transcript_48701/m.136220 type:complete len:306 (-) Transcript_48701:712-1629(-)
MQHDIVVLRHVLHRLEAARAADVPCLVLALRLEQPPRQQFLHPLMREVGEIVPVLLVQQVRRRRRLRGLDGELGACDEVDGGPRRWCGIRLKMGHVLVHDGVPLAGGRLAFWPVGTHAVPLSVHGLRRLRLRRVLGHERLCVERERALALWRRIGHLLSRAQQADHESHGRDRRAHLPLKRRGVRHERQELRPERRRKDEQLTLQLLATRKADLHRAGWIVKVPIDALDGRAVTHGELVLLDHRPPQRRIAITHDLQHLHPRIDLRNEVRLHRRRRHEPQAIERWDVVPEPIRAEAHTRQVEKRL